MKTLFASCITLGLLASPVFLQEREQRREREESEEVEREQEEREEREEDDREEEDEEDEGEEIEERLREAQLQKRMLERKLEVSSKRIRYLREIRDLRREAERIEERFEEGEGNEELEERFGHIALEMGLLEGRLEVLHGRDRLIDLSVDVAESRSRPLRRELDQLEEELDRNARSMERLFRRIAEGEEDEETEEIGGKLEEFAERFDMRLELISMKVELHHMEREGEEEEVEELKEGIKELQGELGLEPRDEDKSEKSDKQEKKQAGMPAIEVNAEDLAAVAQLELRHIAPMLTKACSDCHSGESSSGDLDVEALLNVRPLVVNRKHWVNITQQLRVRSMPPADADQPTEADRKAMVAWLTNAIENFDYSTVHSPGYEPARRLTHEEYNNTIRDLTGIDIRPADRFPNDLTASSGFENSANSLFVQPLVLERYLGAAEAIVDAAWPEQATSDAQRQAWKNLTGDVELSSDTAEQVLRDFLTRAYRRPINNEELTKLKSHFDERMKTDASPRAAIRDVLRVVFVSPSFLIRSEADKDSEKPWRVSDYELASRLSYFLWASTPDEPLLCLAKAGRLHEAGILKGQVQRMLEDPRAQTLGTIFASQWLGFTNLPRVQRDQIDNPWATDSLVEAMASESAMLFNSIIADDQQIDRLVDADYTFVNAELAKHYRMKGVAGDEMRRVSLTESPRRGVLGHASILAITSFPGRTSPVVRGNWVLSSLLGTPPPPPPPNASEFDDRIRESRRLTQRQKLERHRSNPNCYACHSQMDPLGFALEEFEWFGRHRGSRRIDATGQLPGGKPFKGLRGLSKTLIAERVEDLANQVTRKMLSYALGRQLEYYDEATVRSLSKELQGNDRKLTSLIYAIVESDAFQMKQRAPRRAVGVSPPVRTNPKVSNE